MAASTGAASLPEELMAEIMRMLPVKSLIRFKCVCKNWYNLIQSPNFIYNHYNHPNNHTRLLIHYLQLTCLVHPNSKEYIYTSEFTLFSDETLSNTISEDIINPLKPCGHLRNIMGPVNGLFLVNYTSNGDLFYGHLALWNPATMEFRDLPKPTSNINGPLQDFSFSFCFGFGLDPLTRDYKAVMIPNYLRDPLLVQLYTLANDTWRRIDSDFPSSLAHITNAWQSAYLDGVCYWLSCTRPTMVLFDMGREVFREIMAPPSNTIDAEGSRLVLFNDFITLLETCLSNGIMESIDVWIMEGGKCWTRRSIVGLPPIPSSTLLGFWTNGEPLYRSQDSELVMYIPNDRKIQNLGIWRNSIIVLNYKASVASVKGGRKLCQTSYGSRTALTVGY